MKAFYIIALSIIPTFSQAQSTNIPDANFEQALVNLGFDSDGLNGSILNSDAAQVSMLNVSWENISDLTGIEAFTSLTMFSASQNNLTSLDLSSNPTLELVVAAYNELTSINLTGITNLKGLHVEFNQLTTLDLSAHDSLEMLNCYSNYLTSLNLSNNTALTYLGCWDNQLTGTLDISNLGLLEFFSCGLNQISELNLSFHPNMTNFSCGSNNISYLDLTNCPELQGIYLDNNSLVALNIQSGTNQNIINFSVQGNPDLLCIQVDDSSYSSSNSAWLEDPTASYSTDCYWLSLEENTNNEISIFPNPTKNLLNLRILNQIPLGCSYVFLDNIGKIVLEGELNMENTIIDLSELSKGVYFMILDGNSNQTYKVIKE